MPEPKAQLVDPQGPIDVPGINATGIITATGGFVGAVQGTATGFAATTYNLNVGVVTSTGFVGDVTGTASSVTKGTNLSLGIVTASSFAGDVFGNAAGLSTTTAGLKLGIVSATSFAGNFTGIGSGITGTPHIQAGIMTATSFAGNFTGLASGITGTPNLMVGILTGTAYSGDGSNLTGIAATNWVTNNVTADSGTTTVNFSLGNVVEFTQTSNTTVSFANTSTEDDVTIIRSLDPTDISISTGGVDFDDSGDYLTIGSSSDFTMGTGDFTIESWVYPSSGAQGMYQISDTSGGFKISGFADTISVWIASDSTWKYNASGSEISTGVESSTGQWYHVALVRNSGTTSLYVNGSNIHSSTDTTNYNGTYIGIGGYYSTDYLWSGEISNFRIVKGRALYTTDFYPPSTALTNVADTKLLCCQSDSSTTTAAVTPGTITANGDPTAGAQTITLSPSLGSAITWPTGVTWNGGSAPTLAGANDYSLAGQVFNLVTADGGVTWYGYEEVNNTLLSVDYEIWMWGANDNGKMGLNNQTNYSSPIQIPGTNWAPIYRNNSRSTGDWNVYAKTDGTLWTMGKNNAGQLGQGTQGSATYRSSPIQIPGTNWVNASTGYRSTMALKSDGTLWTWGLNINGVLGVNDRTYRSSPTQVPGTNWNTIRLGGSVTVATKTDGTLWSWGMSNNGRDGRNMNSGTPGRRSSPCQIGSGTDWNWAASGEKYCVATKTDGTLWSWGYNNMGILGQNDTTQRSSPVQIPGTDWISISDDGVAAFASMKLA